MADGEGGDGGGGGGGSAEWQPIYDRVEAMVSESQARAEALAADRARQKAADRVQRSWEVARRLQRIVEELQAAAREKDAEMERLRAEAADARKKLQADASNSGRWEAAYLDLLLGANQKLAELRDGGTEDSRALAETPKSKEIESCTNLNQNTVDHIPSDLSAELRKLKQAYETLSSKKDKEVSTLLSEKDFVCNQLSIMQQDYVELLKKKEVEAEQATEAAVKLQKSVDELKALAQKKDDEIARLQAEAVGAKKKHDKDLSALLSEKESLHNQLSIMQQEDTVLLKDHEIVVLRAEAVGAKEKVQQMHSSAKEKNDEIQRPKGCHAESVEKHSKDIGGTHEISMSGDPAVTVRDKLKNTNLSQTVEKDYISETKKVEKDGEAAQVTEASLKLQKSVDELKVLAQNKDDEIGRLQADAMEAKRNLQIMQSLVKEKDDEIRRLRGRYPESIHKRNKDIRETNKKFRSDDPAVRSKSKNNGLMQVVQNYISQTETIGKDWQDEPRQKRRRVSFILNDDGQSGNDEDDDRQSGSDEDDNEQNGSDEVGGEQSGSDEDGEEQSRSDEDGEELSRIDEDGDEQSRRDDDDGQSRRDEHDEDEQSGRNGQTTNNPVQKPLGIPKRKRDACIARFASGKATVKAMVRTKWYCYDMAPAPLCSQKLHILNGRYFVMSTGNWAQYVRDVKDIMADQPDKHKEFIRFLCNFENWRIEDVARTMADLLDGHPELICRFNRFLPKYWQIQIEEEDEELHPDESEVAAAGLIKLKEVQAC